MAHVGSEFYEKKKPIYQKRNTNKQDKFYLFIIRVWLPKTVSACQMKQMPH